MIKKGYIDLYVMFLNYGIFFFIQLEKSSAIDPDYVGCQPRNCGNGPNISFPFYIQGVQSSSCGYPGFHLSCNKDRNPMIYFSGNNYVIDQISYSSQTFRAHNADIFNDNNICDTQQLKNITLFTPFVHVVDKSSLYFLSNCSNSTLEKLNNYKVGCHEKNVVELAMLGNDEKLNYALEGCSKNVVAPVETSKDEINKSSGDVDYVGLMKRGFAVKWDGSDCSECERSGGQCGFNVTSYSFRCFCKDRAHRGSCKKRKSKLGMILGTAGAALLILVIALAIFVIVWRKKAIHSYFPSRSISVTTPKSDREDGSVYFGVHVFSYKELQEITENFDESNELGDGGFGTVYYGKLRDGREVAVKRLYEHSVKRMEQFMNEVEILTRLRHKNLVSLYGCTSRRSRELLLVYEYIPNGTIADHLHGDRAKDHSLTWPVRMKIAIETATALAYLHASDIIHRDVKTYNILLDHNFCVKVADFGLSRLFPNNVTHISTVPQGTPGYVDPEYHQSYQLTEKSDVYSFGVVLIELISSMPAIDISRHSNEINLANYATSRIQRRAFDELIDPSFRKESDTEIVRMTTCVAELAFRCLQLERDLRPTMEEVVETLKAIQNYNVFDEIPKENKAANESRSSNAPLSHESDLSKENIKIMPSPNAVTDLWVSGSTTSTSQ